MRGSAHLDIDEIPSPALLVSRDGSILSANPHSERLFGYGRGELADLELDQLVHTDHREACRQLLETALADHTAASSGQLRQIEGIAKDGRKIAIEADVGPAADRSGVVVVIRDVTVVARLVTELERLRIGVLQTTDLIQVLQIEKDYLEWYGDLDKLLGYGPGEFPHTISGWLELIHPEDSDRIQAEFNRVIAEGRNDWCLRYRIRSADGSYRHLLDRGVFVSYVDGRPNEGIGSIKDETEEVLARLELENSEERFRNLMQQSPLGIVIYSPEGRITEVNPAWMQAWGIDELESARMMTEYNILTDPQLEELGVLPLIEKAFAGERVVLPPIEYSGKRAVEDMGLEDIEPKTVWVQVHLYAIKDEHGAVAHVVVINVDITDLRLAEQDAREQRDALARLNRTTMMEKLTGSIAHELNQPLTGILSSAQAGEMMLKNPQVDHEPNELAEIMAAIVDDTKRASEVIRHLRELYREQKGEFQPVDINGVVDETVQLLHSEVVMQDVTLTTGYDPSVRLASGNRVQIEQVVVNLITNGIEAMTGRPKQDRQLIVATASVANEVRVWVEDRGPGIDADKLDHIFEPLATWKPGGTGMGLSISNSIIQAHGGRMWAENRPEGGARVGFVLPVVEEDHHE